MPRNPDIDNLLLKIQQERSCSLADARRILREMVDVAKRKRLLQSASADIEIVFIPDHENPVFRKSGARVSLHNPFREHVLPPDSEEMRNLPVKRTRVITDAQRASLEKGRQRSAAMKSPASQPKKYKTPIPGTLTGMMVGVMRSPDTDFTQAYTALRSRTQLAHLSDSDLRKRMREISSIYEIPVLDPLEDQFEHDLEAEVDAVIVEFAAYPDIL
jgi:hypothetical protein